MTDPFPEDLEPLKVTCTRSDCENGLHCFLATRQMQRQNLVGRCRSCGISLVDWNRVHLRNPADAEFTFAAMRHEFIRHYFWHIEIDDEALKHASKKGMAAILSDVPKRLLQSIGKSQPFRDGTQTPFHGRVVYYAQHATATCCRKCVEEWHAIPRGRELTRDELAYLASLVTLFLKERVTEVPMEPAPKVPRTRRRTAPKDGLFEPLLEGAGSDHADN